MPVITFWSNNEKAIGQSVSAAVSAAVMAIEHNYKVLLISADYNNNILENCFGAQDSNKEIIKSLIKRPQVSLDSGINGLMKLADSNRVTPDIIHDYTKIVYANRFEVLYSPLNVETMKNTDTMEGFKNIITNASRYYDYVFVDLKKGLRYNSQLEILQMSDVIVANIDQRISSIESFIQCKEMSNMWRKVIWNICRYDSKSKYNTKNLGRTILKKEAIYEVHYNTLISEATQDGTVAELLLRIKTLKENDENTLLVSKIEELNQGIELKYQETRTRM